MKENAKNNDAPILVPVDSFVEGYLKSIKSIRLECNFNGTILTKKKVIVDKASIVKGDVICEEMILFGQLNGNVFCTGRITMHEGSTLNGKVYASTFTSLSETNSDYIVQVPKKAVLEKVRNHLNEVTTEVGLSKDVLLTTLRECFYDNVYSRKKNPDELISYEFTQQKKLMKSKISIVKNKETEFKKEKSISKKTQPLGWSLRLLDFNILLRFRDRFLAFWN